MTKKEKTQKIASEKLCIACGLCCTGHFFTFACLLTDEVTNALALGLQVDQQNKPGNRYFVLPCPLWNGKCPVYDNVMKPDVCGTYKCKLLKLVEGQKVTLKQALLKVQRTKVKIQELEKILPIDESQNFCIRLLPYLDALEKAGIKCDSEEGQTLLKAGIQGDSEARQTLLKARINCDSEEGQTLLKAGILLAQYSSWFGVTQLFTNRRKKDWYLAPGIRNKRLYKQFFTILDEI